MVNADSTDVDGPCLITGACREKMLLTTASSINNYILRSNRDVIVITKCVKKRASKAQSKSCIKTKIYILSKYK